MSSIFASGINWAEQYISLSGKTTAVLVVAAASGEMLVPIVVGQLFDAKGAISLMYVLLGVAVAVLVIFLLLLRLAIGRKPVGRRRREAGAAGGGGFGGGGGRMNGAADGDLSGFLTDMETLDGRLSPDDEDEDDDDGDLGGRSRTTTTRTTITTNGNKQTSFFDKLRTGNANGGGKRRRPGKGKRVTFHLNEKSSHEYSKLTS